MLFIGTFDQELLPLTCAKKRIYQFTYLQCKASPISITSQDTIGRGQLVPVIAESTNATALPANICPLIEARE